MAPKLGGLECPRGRIFRQIVYYTCPLVCLHKMHHTSQPSSRGSVRIHRSALDKPLRPQGWLMIQVSFIAGARSLNEQELRQNLEFFNIPQASTETIRSNLAMKVFDEYANILKGTCSMRFNGRPADGGASTQTHSVPCAPTPPLITSCYHRDTEWNHGDTDWNHRDTD